jgi:hypothetical protein
MQVANVVFTGGSGVEAHLACAMHFMRDLGYIHQRIDGFLPRLLVQRFVMLDVVTSIQRFRRPQLKSDFWFLSPDDQYDRTQPSFREMTGCPQPVLCFFVRISILAADLREDVVDEFEVLTKASTLETDMRIYARSKVTTSTNRPPKASHLDALSQCFYWSAHLLLQRRVYRDATSSLRVQKTVADIVGLIKSMPVGCGPDSSLAFPFYLSSKEAITSEHRDWARQRNEEMKKVYPGRSRDAIMSLLHAMWEAVDIVREREPRMNATIDEILFELESDRELCLF